MRRKSVGSYFIAGIAAFSLSLVNCSPLPLFAQEASNPLTNPHYKAAVTSLEMKDLEGAMKAINQAIRVDPSLAEAYTLRGTLLMGKKSFQKANEDFSQVTRLQPQNAEAYTKLTKSQLMLKDYQAALQSATKATELDPQNQDAELLKRLSQTLVESSQ